MTILTTLNTNKRLLCVIMMANLASGCSTTGANKSDPWEGWNHDVYEFNKSFDTTVFKPVAKGYEDVVPTPINEGVTNVFSNLNDIGVTINDILQLKFNQGGMDFSRFLINTTVGVAGIFDVAKELDLPKHDEDFGQTLGYWGVPSGNYLVLPFIGASSPRDAFGLLGDVLLHPLTYVSFLGGFSANAATTAATGIDATDTRADLMQSEKLLDEASINRYDFIKNTYTQRREYLVRDGKQTEQASDDPWVDEPTDDNKSSSTTPAAAQALPAATDVGNSLNKSVTSSPSNTATVIDNSTTTPKQNTSTIPGVINNTKHILELSSPDPK